MKSLDDLICERIKLVADNIRREAVLNERTRIMDIVNRATEKDMSAARVGAAVLIALQTDLSPDDAIAVLNAQQTSEPVRPN